MTSSAWGAQSCETSKELSFDGESATAVFISVSGAEISALKAKTPLRPSSLMMSAASDASLANSHIHNQSSTKGLLFKSYTQP